MKSILTEAVPKLWKYRKAYTLVFVEYNSTISKVLPKIEDSHGMLQATFKSNVDRWVLLGRKQRGIGKGNLNGFGGKVELHDLSPLLAAVRELEEESGLRVAPELFDEAARLYFTFERQEELMEVFVFVCRNWVPTLTSLNNPNWPRTTEEMHPCWFPLNPNSSQDSQVCDLPYNEMWPDDRFWLPSALMGRRCLLWSHFRRPLSVQKPEASSKDPFELLCYQLKTFDCPSELLGISDQSTIFNSNDLIQDDKNPLQKAIRILDLDSDDSLLRWISCHPAFSKNINPLGTWTGEAVPI